MSLQATLDNFLCIPNLFHSSQWNPQNNPQFTVLDSREITISYIETEGFLQPVTVLKNNIQKKWNALLLIMFLVSLCQHIFYFDYLPSNSGVLFLFFLLKNLFLQELSWFITSILKAADWWWKRHEIWLINSRTNGCYLTSPEPSLLLGHLLLNV